MDASYQFKSFCMYCIWFYVFVYQIEKHIRWPCGWISSLSLKKHLQVDPVACNYGGKLGEYGLSHFGFVCCLILNQKIAFWDLSTMALEYAYHFYSMACLQVYLSQTTAANRFSPNLISSFIDIEKHTGGVFSEIFHTSLGRNKCRGLLCDTNCALTFIHGAMMTH